MSAMAQTGGSMTRAIAICEELTRNGHTVAFCAGEDRNFKAVKNITNYAAPVPSPLGLPPFLGKRVFKFAQLSGVQQRKTVNSFEEVLRLTGATNERYFANDLDCLRRAIKDFHPDIVYSEFRMSAIVAAKIEKIAVAASISYPSQAEYASNPEYSKKVREFLRGQGLPPVLSLLEVFKWADIRFVPSSHDLEPFDDEKVIFTGALIHPENIEAVERSNVIVAYMGNGSITSQQTVQELSAGFRGSRYDVYIAAGDVSPERIDNITIDKRFDFSAIRPGAMAYINHGGQNSVMSGLIYGVPQVICAGNVFERKYNADSVVNQKSGLSFAVKEFTAERLKTAIRLFENDNSYRVNAFRVGKDIMKLGGVKTIVAALQDYTASTA
jgi:UDP:flavonoid glycosyltransferase YjiC (YdhE family)